MLAYLARLCIRYQRFVPQLEQGKQASDEAVVHSETYPWLPGRKPSGLGKQEIRDGCASVKTLRYLF